MIKQTLAFTNPAHLSLKNAQMVIDTRSDRGVLTRPIEDIGVVMVESHCVTITSALLAALLANNTAVIVCDGKHMPSGLMLPLAGNSLITERVRRQVAASLPLRKQLWQQTVAAKIMNQGRLLRSLSSEPAACMAKWAGMVRSGDADNLEARAAIFYWRHLFADNPKFMRGDELDGVNSLLDYGYAILRAIIARAVVATGLMPQLGLFHSNKYNAYCLADDLMEPYRPYVDQIVWSIRESHAGKEIALTPEVKKELLQIPVADVEISGLRRPLMVAANMTTSSLWKCYNGEARKLAYPEMPS